MYTCKYCGKELKRPCALVIHERTCKSNPNRKPLEKHVCEYTIYKKNNSFNEYNVYNDNLYCHYCSKQCKNLNSLKQHEIRCKKNPEHIQSPFIEFNKKRGAWNKGLTKETDERVKKYSETYKEKIKSGEITPSFKGKHHNSKTIEKLRKCGGYRKGSGFGKSGWYNGYFCDSSWELAFVIFNLEHNIVFERNKQKFKYVYNGIVKTYLPDFIIGDVYYEIKGYKNKQWMSKLEQFPNDKKLIIIEKEEIKPYLDYVISKYGKDFIKLYE